MPHLPLEMRQLDDFGGEIVCHSRGSGGPKQQHPSTELAPHSAHYHIVSRLNQATGITGLLNAAEVKDGNTAAMNHPGRFCRGTLRDNQSAGPIQHLFQTGFQEIGDVRNGGQDESLVAAVDLFEADVWIEDAYVATLTD